MRELSGDILNWHGAGKRMALATVIKAWGSAPRPVGSHMLVSDQSEMSGSVSGGCVETAVVEEAQGVIKSGAPKHLKFGVTNEEAWSIGLACGGKIEIFVQPFFSEDPFNRDLRAALEKNQTAVTATAIKSSETASGEHIILTENSANKTDHPIFIQKFINKIDLKNPPREAFLLEKEDGAFFIQPYLPPRRLVVIGGVHIAVPLTKFAQELGYDVRLVDPRTAFANSKRFPHVKHIMNDWPQDALPKLKIDQNTFVVLLTHDPKIDDPALKTVLAANPAYIGVLGSKRTHEKRIQRLREAGIEEAKIAGLHAPIGLKIGAKSTAEIALSILAQMTAIRRGANIDDEK